MSFFSEYYVGLTGSAEARYREKVFTCGFDPYVLKKSECSNDLADYPSKSMDAYNFFVSGWVNTIFTKLAAGTDKVVVTARVNHSKRARDTPLKTWLLAEKDGTVCMAHCNCMAGLCEACSHVGALLFAIEAGV